MIGAAVFGTVFLWLGMAHSAWPALPWVPVHIQLTASLAQDQFSLTPAI
jgi:hypothetical protein